MKIISDGTGRGTYVTDEGGVKIPLRGLTRIDWTISATSRLAKATLYLDDVELEAVTPEVTLTPSDRPQSE